MQTTTAVQEKRNWIGRAAADLFPGYFALVMATGIISIAAFMLGRFWISRAMLIVNLIAYPVLCLLLLIRLVSYFDRVRNDFANHSRSAGFFTVVAGTCVFGSQLLIVTGRVLAATVLWFVGLGFWLVVTYAFFAAMTLRENKPPLETGLNGAWLIAVVATQSVSVLGTLLASRYASFSDAILFFTLCMFLLGCMLYLMLMTLIFYRFTFVNFTVILLTPPYWINMGAVAITTLAGARLILAEPSWSVLGDMLPFLKGFTLFFWAAGTWWIPLLFVFGVWRHFYKRFPLTYDPQYWGMVFPLGMYSAATFQLARAIKVDFLLFLPPYFLYLALVAWLVTFVGLVHSILSPRLEPSPGTVR